MKYAKLNHSPDAPLEQVGGGNLNIDIPESISGGDASLDTMPQIPDDFDGSQLATLGAAPGGLEDYDELLPATPAVIDPANPVVEPVVESAVGNDPQTVKQTEDAAFWQSKHDKLQNDFELKLERTKNEILQQTMQERGQPDPEPVVELKAPVKPSDYDSFEADSNPDSSSYKWREAVEDYKVQKAVNAVKAELTEKDQQRDQQTARATAVQNIKTQALQFAGNDQAKADQFVQFLNSPQSYDLGLIYRAYEASIETPNIPSVAQQNLEQNQRLNQAPIDPAGVVSGQAPQVLSDEQKFNEARKRNLQRADY